MSFSSNFSIVCVDRIWKVDLITKNFFLMRKIHVKNSSLSILLSLWWQCIWRPFCPLVRLMWIFFSSATSSSGSLKSWMRTFSKVESLWQLYIYMGTLDIFFSSNHNIHKSSCGLCFLASDPLIDTFY